MRFRGRLDTSSAFRDQKKKNRGLWVRGGDASSLANNATQKVFFTFAARQHSKGMPITTVLLEDEGLSKGDAASAAAFGKVVKTAAGKGCPPPPPPIVTPQPRPQVS